MLGGMLVLPIQYPLRFEVPQYQLLMEIVLVFISRLNRFRNCGFSDTIYRILNLSYSHCADEGFIGGNGDGRVHPRYWSVFGCGEGIDGFVTEDGKRRLSEM